MKKSIFIIGIMLLMFQFRTANAQVSVNINIDQQPAWGPTGYDRANFYYFPDLNVYFDVNNSLFYYFSASKWNSNRYLPNKYSKYDLYNLYKVVLNNNSKPWLKNNIHKKSYAKFKSNRNQIPIRSTNDNKYKQSRNNSISWVNTGKSGNSNSGKGNKNTNARNNNNQDRDRTTKKQSQAERHQ